MIIVSIFGGLGNQMFQYATAKAVALRLGVELKLDLTHLEDRTVRENFTYRDYELGVFSLNDKIATAKEVQRYAPNFWIASEYIKKAYKLKRMLTGRHLYWEKKKFIFENRILSVKDNTYLYGYFQTEKYFQDYGQDILNAFILREEMDEKNSRLASEMASVNSVSIHVRRGDYLHNPFQLLDMENYYREAMTLISEKVKNPVFYIFTNDYQWVHEQFLSVSNKVIVSHNQAEKSFLDMKLMSCCRHNIIANSSFSWWGAWLNFSSNKIVIAPSKWFKEISMDFTDIIPENWLHI